MNFCVAILILPWKKIHNIVDILCFIISRKVKTQLKHKKRFVQCVEKVLWLIKYVKRGLQSFMLEISWIAPQSGRQVEVDSNQIKTLIENKQHYTMWEIANIFQISKSIKLLMEMKNLSFILCKNTIQTFWPTQYFSVASLKTSWVRLGVGFCG